MREDTLALAHLHLDNLSIAEIVRGLLIRYLNHLELEVGGQSLGVLRDTAHQIFFLQFAYADDLN
ncbi:hypothetical protein D3C75_1086680 [compost metagenome]